MQKWVQVLKKYFLNKEKGRKEKPGQREIERGTIVTLICSTLDLIPWNPREGNRHI